MTKCDFVKADFPTSFEDRDLMVADERSQLARREPPKRSDLVEG